ncbi:hypothetical protein EV360DRAFT_75910 [Lentinula raphanica]|nr:hypothetical protein EV360DRAFT_75910 [Lentinula raphanica]
MAGANTPNLFVWALGALPSSLPTRARFRQIQRITRGQRTDTCEQHDKKEGKGLELATSSKLSMVDRARGNRRSGNSKSMEGEERERGVDWDSRGRECIRNRITLRGSFSRNN